MTKNNMESIKRFCYIKKKTISTKTIKTMKST